MSILIVHGVIIAIFLILIIIEIIIMIVYYGKYKPILSLRSDDLNKLSTRLERMAASNQDLSSINIDDC